MKRGACGFAQSLDPFALLVAEVGFLGKGDVVTQVGLVYKPPAATFYTLQIALCGPGDLSVEAVNAGQNLFPWLVEGTSGLRGVQDQWQSGGVKTAVVLPCRLRATGSGERVLFALEDSSALVTMRNVLVWVQIEDEEEAAPWWRRVIGGG